MAEKKSVLDQAVDGVLENGLLALREIKRQNKGNRPFRQERVSRKETLLDFDDMMSREAQLRQQFGDDVIDAYKRAMASKLKLGGKEK